MGVWIETGSFGFAFTGGGVTPCMGVWIETPLPVSSQVAESHTLYGCVD